MIQRHLIDAVRTALGDTPVVLLHGPRQCGKSTLVRWICEHGHKAAYHTLDDAAILSAVNRDPAAFIQAVGGPVAIDEVQLAPGLLRAIKADVDRKRTPGRFLLTGSANMLHVPNLSESLAGRIEILSLAPFSAGELLGTQDRFVDWLFQARGVPALTGRNMPWPELLRRIVVGGYPEVTRRGNAARRHAWFGSYLTTILQRDVRQMADIAGLTELPRLFALLAAQSGGLLNMAELSRDAGISQPTMKRYLTLLQATDLYQPLTAWASNARKRLIKSAKAYLNDTGLLAYLLGLNAGQLAGPTANVGRMLEAFVCQELRKQISWSKSRPTLHYYRTTDGKEVDFVLEHRGGQVVGIDVKASVGLKREDLRGLDDLAETTGKRFRRGIVLYAGAEVIPFSSTIMALPISALWRVG